MRNKDKARGKGFAISRDLNPTRVPIDSLVHLGRETRKHSPAQIRKLVRSLAEQDFVLPILIDPMGRVVAGWGLVLAARQLGLSEVPAVTVTNLSEAKLKQLRLALNRLAEDAEWDREELTIEFNEILELEPDIDLTLTGFAMAEVDILLDGGGEDEEDVLPVVDGRREPKSQIGDVWKLADHRIICSNALDPETHAALMGDDRAQMVFTDPPYNVPVDGHVCGLGSVKHQDFQMASGEMTSAQFTDFLSATLGLAAGHSVDGSFHMIFMDWRHLPEIHKAGENTYDELKNLCVWNKSNAGMGALWRSQHELILIFKKGTAPHINNVALGRYGRNRTNVWSYPSQNTMNAKSKLSLHPTVKPVGLVADAIRDCSNRGDIILDPFGGAGTTLIAAEKTGRKARLIEIEPRYVDVTVERWQRLTGGTAIHAETGRPFDEHARILA
ncbi:DNA methyltransferase [Hyphomonas sp.]|uniref:site-specific DNA-methyltransferase n=1 Tax=Alphaproteobacteria TaxID=28211 RepID=UPI0032645709